MHSVSLRFAETARVLANTARHAGLRVPMFRSPPSDPRADRSIRWVDHQATVAVRLADRGFDEWQGDMIEGILLANGFHDPGAAADDGARLREVLWQALTVAGLDGRVDR